MAGPLITLDALNLCAEKSERIEAWSSKAGEMPDGFASEQGEDWMDRQQPDGNGGYWMDPMKVLDGAKLAETVAALKMERDPEIVELYVLGAMQLHVLHGSRLPPRELALANAIAERSVQLLTLRPELAHPALHVTRYSTRFGHRSLLSHLVVARVRFEPDSLEQAVKAKPVLRDLLRSTFQQEQEASLFKEMTVDGGCPKLLQSMLRVLPELLQEFGTEENLLKLAALCAANSHVRARHDEMLGLMDELQATQARAGDGARFKWMDTGENIMAETAMHWAGVRNHHPVLSFFYDTAVEACHLTASRRLKMSLELAPGYPAVPITTLAERLNAMMEPAAQIAPSSISAHGLVELLALAPIAAKNGRALNYWARIQDADSVPKVSLVDILEWAAKERTDGAGRRMELADFDALLDVYRRSIGEAATSRIRSTLLQREMSKVLEAGASADPIPATGRSRRCGV